MSLGDVSIHHKNIVLLHCPNMFCPSIKMIRLVHKDLPYFFGYKTEIFSRRNNPKNLHPSYKQGCRQHAYFLPSAAGHGLHGVSLLPLANYVHMHSVIPAVHMK